MKPCPRCGVVECASARKCAVDDLENENGALRAVLAWNAKKIQQLQRQLEDRPNTNEEVY
jgi:dynactin complex subunit